MLYRQDENANMPWEEVQENRKTNFDFLKFKLLSLK